MGWFRSKDLLDRTFEVGILLKGLDGALELIGGALLLMVSPATINRITGALTQHELSEDPHDVIATHLLRISHGLTGSAVGFAAAYLLLHGIVKVVLVLALLRNKLWAYPWMIAFLIAFIAYQLYRYSFTHDFSLILLSIFDVFVIALAVHEYRLLRKHLPTH